MYTMGYFLNVALRPGIGKYFRDICDIFKVLKSLDLPDKGAVMNTTYFFLFSVITNAEFDDNF